MPDDIDSELKDLNEAPPVDSLDLLSKIAEALGTYARTVPDVAVAKVRFGLIPFVEIQQNTWRATVTLECLGGLERTEEPKVQEGDEPAEFLEGVKPVQVYEKTWAGQGPGSPGAIAALFKVIENFMRSTMREREAEAGAMREALDGLVGKELPELWSDEDPDYVNPQEDIPADPG